MHHTRISETERTLRHESRDRSGTWADARLCRFPRADAPLRGAAHQVTAAALTPACPRPGFGPALQFVGRLFRLSPASMASGRLEDGSPRLFPAAARALWRFRRTDRRGCPAMPAPARRSRRRDGGGDRQSRHVVLGGVRRSRQAAAGRDRARQRRDWDFRPARRADRQASGREKGDRDRAQSGSAGLARRARRRCDDRA